MGVTGGGGGDSDGGKRGVTGVGGRGGHMGVIGKSEGVSGAARGGYPMCYSMRYPIVTWVLPYVSV